jgi:hypothetical protein
MSDRSPDTPTWSEAERLAALRDYEILDTEPERAFDDIVDLVATLFDAPIAVVNLVDEGRQWFKAEKGLGVRETPLDTSFCAHAICREDYAGLTADLGLQFRRGAADRQPRVIHFIVFHQTGEDLCLIEHSVNMLRLRQLLRFAATWDNAQLLTLGNLLDNQ